MSAEAPKCKLCGVAHWSNEPHMFGPVSKNPVNNAEKPAVQKMITGQNQGLTALFPGGTPELSTASIEICTAGHRFAALPDHPKLAGVFVCPHCCAEADAPKSADRKAYMREYMARRRAKERAE